MPWSVDDIEAAKDAAVEATGETNAALVSLAEAVKVLATDHELLSAEDALNSALEHIADAIVAVTDARVCCAAAAFIAGEVLGDAMADTITTEPDKEC